MCAFWYLYGVAVHMIRAIYANISRKNTYTHTHHAHTVKIAEKAPNIQNQKKKRKKCIRIVSYIRVDHVSN